MFTLLLLLCFFSYLPFHLVVGAVCEIATVGQPFSDCFDIWTAAGITEAQLLAFNPGLDCSLLAIGQKLCITAGTLPGQPQQNPDGSCATYTTVSGDSCSAIGVKFSITVANIEIWNANTFHWNGCAALQANFTMCVSSGTPPPPPIIAGLQCGPQSQGNLTCPLNACCSAFGFCGLTDEFCTTTGANPCISNCGEPTLPSCASSRSIRKIGYYAGWGDRRACGTNVAPDETNWAGFTGAHFAFATISQGLEIQLDDVDAPLLQQLVGQKTNFPGLQVIIAVGGWDFSEDDPTRDLFSVMISTSSARATFISSVKAFLTQFGLDGIDIDFEYPSAIERAAPATDTPNLTSFFQELRAALPTQVISCATPAGYWFLQGFQIDKIAASVSYLNMMSYDYHGPWDTNVTDQAPVTNPHTSILDMHDSASLYIRAGINLNNVNLGIAYYGRTYQLADSSCVGYNCTMTGGGFPGNCTSTPGILAQFEIQSLLDSGISPTLDQPTETYWFDKSGSLVTFDQQDTWVAKTLFAETTCFGGTFIWSLDQVTSSNPGDGGGSLAGGGSSGSGNGGLFTSVEWNPNPFPSPGAASETFVQAPGVTISTITSVVSQSTVTTTTTFVVPAFTSLTTSFTVVSGSIQTIDDTETIPATTSTATITITEGFTVTSVSTVTKTATTIIVPVPQTTTTVNVEGVILTLNSGGTPVNFPVPTGISQPNAITPTFNKSLYSANISPTQNATVIVYTAPLTSPVTWSSTITIPPKSTSPPVVVTGPPGDHSRCGGTLNIWSILFGGIILGCPPADVGIIDGITPHPFPPPSWTGFWSDPFNLPTAGSDPDSTNTQSESSSSSSSSTSTSACAIRTPGYNLPDDPENADWSDLGSDPDRRRKRDLMSATDSAELQRRAGREANISPCGITITSPTQVDLAAGDYYLVPLTDGEYTSTLLDHETVGAKPDNPEQAPETNQEHVFEIGYINQFFSYLANAGGDCTWILRDVVNYVRRDRSMMGAALLAAIDNTQNMVWVDKPMNQAKSNVVNNNKASPGDPPQAGSTVSIINFSVSNGEILDIETFLRNFAALGQYFDQTSSIFSNTAGDFQQLLSEVTPSVILDNSRSLPVIFRDWLAATVAQYPDGCTDRAINAWNFYRSHMQSVAALFNNGVVPDCFPLYTANIYHPSTFDSEDLLPPAPTTPSCNVPGTMGTVGYVGGGMTVTSITPGGSPERIMGAGNLNFYAAGTGTSLTDAHYQIIDASAIGPQCTNVFAVIDDMPNAQGSLGDANIDLQCGGSIGSQQVDFNWVFNGQPLGCAAFAGAGTDGTLTQIFCSANQGAALACASGGPAQAFTIQMRWFPS
ncbi:hypothetical protein C8R44DRAFT_853060 [Mycena epipterygia]|nr:hypothetical protein C8R44DRAFT_853060 [Mycena epipterygia]